MMVLVVSMIYRPIVWIKASQTIHFVNINQSITIAKLKMELIVYFMDLAGILLKMDNK